MVMKTIVIALFFILFLTNMSYSLTPSYINAYMDIEEDINVERSDLVDSITIEYPLSEEAQIIEMEGCNGDLKGSNIHIYFKNIREGTNKCKLMINVSSYLKRGITRVPWSEEEALKESEHITFEPLIINVSRSIQYKCGNNNYCKVKESVAWIHQFLVYDESLSDKNYGVKEIIKMRKGVCAEYVTLFMALMRSMNIPAVYASSYAYNGKDYEPHAYAYVKINKKWYPVDVLWKQIGYVDSTHIFLGWSYDNQIQSNLNALQKNGGSVDWFKESIKVKEIKRKEINLVEPQVLFNTSSQGLILKTSLLSNLDFICGEIVVVPCNYKTWEIKKSIICNNEYLIYEYSLDLPSNVLFTCPFTIYDIEKDAKTVNITVDTSFNGASSLTWLVKLKLALLSFLKNLVDYI